MAMRGIGSAFGGSMPRESHVLSLRGLASGLLLGGARLGTHLIAAFLTYELLELLWACWSSHQRPSLIPTGVLLEKLFGESFIEDYFIVAMYVLAMLACHHWQVISNDMAFEGLDETVGDGGATDRASKNSTKNLPWHVVHKNGTLDSNGEPILCPICLQELVDGETARSLPYCYHTFHMDCIDEWLFQHKSCPMCRRMS